MTQFRKGWSLAHALSPKTQPELDLLLADSPCPACENRRGELDEGEVYNLGFVIYREILKQCDCGFQDRLFVILNDIKRQQTPLITSTAKALELAHKRGLVPDPTVEEAFSHLMLAHHQGDLVLATELGEALINKSPKNPHVWYNLGWCYMEVGRWCEALAAFRQTRDLDQNYTEAWHHESRVAYRLGVLPIAREAREVDQGQGGEDIAEPDVVLEEGVGMFGHTSLVRDPDLYHLLIGTQDQGSLYVDPPAARYYPDIPGPGPFSPNYHINGMLLAPLPRPEGRLLMFGLGTGAGLIAMLHHYPKLTITVIEVDRLVAKMSFNHIPLLRYFQEKGRLILVEQDAATYLEEQAQHFDVAVLDLYQGKNEQPYLSTDFLRSVHNRCDHLWLNLSGCLVNAHIENVLQGLSDIGKPVQYLSASVSPRAWTRLAANWLVSTAEVDAEEASGFAPYKNVPGEAGKVLHGHWRMLMSWHLRASNVASYLARGILPSFPM